MKSRVGLLALVLLGFILITQATFAIRGGGIWLTVGKVILGLACLCFAWAIAVAKVAAPRALALGEICLAVVGAVVAFISTDVASGVLALLAGGVAAADGIGRFRGQPV